jgi:glycosyltransferase involved in cell wall biosynthesis
VSLDVSVILCSHNRAESLERTLESLSRLKIPESLSWELILVLNGTSDHSSKVAEKFSGKLPLQCYDLKIAGLSVARNHAIQAARGRLLLFTDDDVEVDPLWVQSLWSAHLRYPQAHYFGGMIEPYLDKNMSMDFSRFSESLFDGLLLRKNLGSQERALNPGETFFGANMAFLYEVFHWFQFRADLGRVGNHLLSGEETELIQQCQERNWIGIWIPDAKIKHWMGRERLSIPYIITYFWGLGTSLARMAKKNPPRYPPLKFKTGELTYTLASAVLFFSYCFEISRLKVQEVFIRK